MPTTVTAAAPTNGTVQGGTEVTITGTQFNAGARVVIGGVAATNVRVVSAVQIVATAAARPRAGRVDIVVTNTNGTHGTGVGLFEYWANLTAIEPNTGTVAGGTPVTLTGTGFPVGCTVRIGGLDAGAVVVNPAGTSITATTPVHAAGKAHVYIHNPAPGALGGGRRNAFTYSAPAVTGASPPTVPAAGGVDVTLVGDFFAAGATVTFGGTPSAAAPVVNSAQEIVARAPAHAVGRVDIVVTVGGQAITLAGAIEYVGAAITEVDPATGPAAGGTDIRITGERFDTAVLPTVQVGGVAVTHLVVVNATTITARTAATPAGTADVTVQNAGQPVVTLPGAFQLVAAPTVTAISPARGAPGGGTAITIRGTHFASDAVVTVDGVAATGVQVVSPTTITATTVAHGGGTFAVAVRNPGAPAVPLNAAFTFSSIERVVPDRALPAGGQPVVIHGSGFAGMVAVTFGGTAAPAVVVDSAERLTVTTPAHVAGAVDVVVDAAGVATLAGGLTYSPVTALDPPGGPVGGNTAVTITGDGFPVGTTVRFGATPAAAVVRTNAQELVATTPAVAAGAVDVVLQGEGLDVTVAGGFTFRPVATVAAIEPADGPVAGGTAVTITGTGLVQGAVVTIAGVAVVDVVVVSDTTITGTTAAAPPPVGVGARPAVDVVVTNPADAAVTGAGLFRYRDPPTVAAVEPARGPTAGDRWITVTGREYVPGAMVLVANQPAAEVIFHDAQTLYARVPAHAAAACAVAVRNPGEPAGPQRADAFTYVTTPSETGGNEVVFLLDGRRYFEELRVQFEAVRQAAPHELTYVRLAFWMIEEDVTLGDENYFERPNHRLLVYIDQLIRAGHDVDVIVWCPSKHHRFQMGAQMAETNGAFGRAVYAVDQAAAAAGPHVGRARAFLEPYEGEVGASNHEKMAIFSIAGVRTALVGGINLSNHYFAPEDHSGGMHWHDAAVRLRGPVTGDVEVEWMRRWNRTQLIAEYWGWNAVGWGGELLARDFTFWNAQVVRRRAVQAPQNTTRQPAHGDDRAVSIALTRSVGAERYRDIRDQILERIDASRDFIYFENYHFADPELVQRIIQHHRDEMDAGRQLRVVILVPQQGGASGFMTRRAWLHMLLNFTTPAPARVPLWRTIWYDLGQGAGEVRVHRADCATHSVTDTYDAATPWTLANRWIDGDHFTYRLAAGGGDVDVPLDAITRAAGDFHFYMCRHRGANANIYKHAKIAIFGDEWLVCGTSNWSYRSMQYDGEIAAFVHSPAVAAATRQQLLGHFNPTPGGLPPITPANIEAQSHENLRALLGLDGVRLAALGDRVLLPLCHAQAHPHLALPREKPGIQEAPNFTWY